MRFAPVIGLLCFAFNFLYISAWAGSAGVEFQAPPYVFSRAGEHIVLAWSYKDDSVPVNLKAPVTATINDGVKSEELQVATDEELYYAQLPLPNCGFGDNVTYQVTGMSEPAAIKNIKCPGENTASKFVFLADTQVEKAGVKPLLQFNRVIEKFNPQALLIGGDLVQNGDKSVLWNQLLRSIHPVIGSTVLIPGIGNHEYHWDPNVGNWFHFFRIDAHAAYYITNVGDTQIISLNSCFWDDPLIVTPERMWLETQLMLSKPRWRIVFFHHPTYSNGIMHNPVYPKREFETLRKDFMPLFEKYKVDMVLSGHVHLYERSEKDGIVYMTSGPAAGQIGIFGGVNPYSIRKERMRTAIEFTVDHNQFLANAVDINGNVIDTVRLHKDDL